MISSSVNNPNVGAQYMVFVFGSYLTSLILSTNEIVYVYLDDLSVTGAYRGRGIGTALIRQAEAYVERLGIPHIVFHVEKANERAHGLYLRLGYRDDEEQGERIRMAKTVGRWAGDSG